MAAATAERSLSTAEKRTLALLGLPTFALALAITVVSTYLPVVAKTFTGSTMVIGLLVGAEGVLALFVPLLVGTWSDQLRTRLGGRLPFVAAAAPVVTVALVALGFVAGIPGLVVAVTIFFFAYFVAYEPYRALYPDLLDDEVAGRAQSSQAVARGAGTGLALLAGGLLLSITRALPFVASAVIVLLALTSFVWLCTRRGAPEQDYEQSRSVREAAGDVRSLLAEHPALRWYMAANALWELSLGALKTFIVLFLTVGLGLKLSEASLAIGAAAVLILAGAAVAGKVGDRFGRHRVMRVSLWVYGLGLLVPFLTQSPLAIVAVPFVAVGGAVIMSLPYALLMPLMPEGAHGALTGYYSLSRGIGTMLGPILGGIAVQLARGPLAGTKGYAAVFLVCSLAILASIPMMRGLSARREDRRALRES